ncbi:unnamed protein product [Amoebophrya sp. A120]|nr:unnamed protein product [Amoebophrya sp. A120]|eukprot:GSA120T00017607001.1
MHNSRAGPPSAKDRKIQQLEKELAALKAARALEGTPEQHRGTPGKIQVHRALKMQGGPRLSSCLQSPLGVMLSADLQNVDHLSALTAAAPPGLSPVGTASKCMENLIREYQGPNVGRQSFCTAKQAAPGTTAGAATGNKDKDGKNKTTDAGDAPEHDQHVESIKTASSPDLPLRTELLRQNRDLLTPELPPKKVHLHRGTAASPTPAQLSTVVPGTTHSGEVDDSGLCNASSLSLSPHQQPALVVSSSVVLGHEEGEPKATADTCTMVAEGEQTEGKTPKISSKLQSEGLVVETNENIETTSVATSSVVDNGERLVEKVHPHNATRSSTAQEDKDAASVENKQTPLRPLGDEDKPQEHSGAERTPTAHTGAAERMLSAGAGATGHDEPIPALSPHLPADESLLLESPDAKTTIATSPQVQCEDLEEKDAESHVVHNPTSSCTKTVAAPLVGTNTVDHDVTSSYAAMLGGCGKGNNPSDSQFDQDNYLQHEQDQHPAAVLENENMMQEEVILTTTTNYYGFVRARSKDLLMVDGTTEVDLLYEAIEDLSFQHRALPTEKVLQNYLLHKMQKRALEKLRKEEAERNAMPMESSVTCSEDDVRDVEEIKCKSTALCLSATEEAEVHQEEKNSTERTTEEPAQTPPSSDEAGISSTTATTTANKIPEMAAWTTSIAEVGERAASLITHCMDIVDGVLVGHFSVAYDATVRQRVVAHDRKLKDFQGYIDVDSKDNPYDEALWQKFKKALQLVSRAQEASVFIKRDTRFLMVLRVAEEMQHPCAGEVCHMLNLFLGDALEEEDTKAERVDALDEQMMGAQPCSSDAAPAMISPPSSDRAVASPPPLAALTTPPRCVSKDASEDGRSSRNTDNSSLGEPAYAYATPDSVAGKNSLMSEQESNSSEQQYSTKTSGKKMDNENAAASTTSQRTPSALPGPGRLSYNAKAAGSSTTSTSTTQNKFLHKKESSLSRATSLPTAYSYSPGGKTGGATTENSSGAAVLPCGVVQQGLHLQGQKSSQTGAGVEVDLELLNASMRVLLLRYPEGIPLSQVSQKLRLHTEFKHAASFPDHELVWHLKQMKGICAVDATRNWVTTARVQ